MILKLLQRWNKKKLSDNHSFASCSIFKTRDLLKMFGLKFGKKKKLIYGCVAGLRLHELCQDYGLMRQTYIWMLCFEGFLDELELNSFMCAQDIMKTNFMLKMNDASCSTFHLYTLNQKSLWQRYVDEILYHPIQWGFGELLPIRIYNMADPIYMEKKFTILMLLLAPRFSFELIQTTVFFWEFQSNIHTWKRK